MSASCFAYPISPDLLYRNEEQNRTRSVVLCDNEE